MKEDLILTYHLASTVIAVSAFIYLHDKMKTMKSLLDAARRITENISEHDAHSIKILKRRFNLAYDESFGVRHPTQKKVKARATWDA